MDIYEILNTYGITDQTMREYIADTWHGGDHDELAEHIETCITEGVQE